MPNRAQWEPDHAVGHELIDAQHRGLLAHCNLLADLCETGEGATQVQAFDHAFEQLKTLARAHFETEAAELERFGYDGLEDHRFECDEFEYLADEIATTENFDRIELQRFVTLWFVGHVAGTAGRIREALAGGGSAG